MSKQPFQFRLGPCIEGCWDVERLCLKSGDGVAAGCGGGEGPPYLLRIQFGRSPWFGLWPKLETNQIGWSPGPIPRASPRKRLTHLTAGLRRRLTSGGYAVTSGIRYF